MLAKSRKDSVIGRTMMLEKNSSGMMIGHMAFGTPEGSTVCLRYPSGPCLAMPTPL